MVENCVTSALIDRLEMKNVKVSDYMLILPIYWSGTTLYFPKSFNFQFNTRMYENQVSPLDY